MKKYNVCMVGIGAVGTEIVRLLRKREFPIDKFTVFATRERTEMIDGIPVDVQVATGPESFKEYDFAFFAGTEGAKGASKTLGWGAAEAGCIVVDNGDDFRMDPRVPLVIPEVNPEALRNHSNFIANPNHQAHRLLHVSGRLRFRQCRHRRARQAGPRLGRRRTHHP